ncbi:hypothetical protein DPMN_156951 [Dreissena polymorpha]|uniref:Uncharacterized protein n=1 Tax=Dreissena polymorpha TaxID=45954 RepID=A0A9D4FT97_DREPO|nr:hypothetical protein DPMN_156951 [Dreissena polymorpha]
MVAVGYDDCDYDKDLNADTDNSDDDNVYDVYDSCEEDDSDGKDGEDGDNDDVQQPPVERNCGKNCANPLTEKDSILIASRFKGDGRPSWKLIVELQTATERREQREHPLNLNQNWNIF